MSEATHAREARILPARPAAARTLRYWPWLAALLVSVVLPWLFYDWQSMGGTPGLSCRC